MRIGVIGGSGFVGTHLIRALTNQHDVIILDKIVSSEFEDITLKGDIRDVEFLKNNLEDIDLVIHLAAEHKDNVTPPSLYYDVNVQGMQNILQAMDRNDISDIIFTSTVALYGLNKNNPDENQDPDPFNDYGKSKWEAEKILRSWYSKNESKKTVAVIRPTVIFGEDNRGNVYNLLQQIVSGRFVMVGKGDNKKSLAYVGNIVQFIMYLTNNMSEEKYTLYNYADKPDLRTSQLIDTVIRTLDVRVPSFSVPYWLGLTGGYFFDGVAKVTGRKLPISSVRVKKFCATTQFKAGKAHNEFNPPYTLNEGLKNTLKYEFDGRA